MQVSFYEPRNKDGKIRAFADVDVAEGVIVRGFRVVDGAKGLFASVPQRSVMVSGQTRYMNQVVFAKPELKERFLAELLEAYRAWLDARRDPSPDTGDAAGAGSV